MPVPLAPYPTPPAPYSPPAANGILFSSSVLQQIYLETMCSKSACVFRLSKFVDVSCWSNLCVLCCLQCSNSSAASRHRDGPVSLRRLPYLANVHPWSNKRSMFMLSHCQSGLGSKSGGTRKLWKLQDVTNVPVWSKICKMCSLQFCDISWGLSKRCRAEVQQLKVTLHSTSLVLHITNIFLRVCVPSANGGNSLVALY
ncbi:hypothetical protein V6N13_036212 [Hibiscus sabdariffa]